MSLKAFHVAFIGSSILLMLVLAGWCFRNYRDGREALDLVWGALAFGAAVGLLVYGRYFLKKLKHISYL